jgi:hypothetical protein
MKFFAGNWRDSPYLKAREDIPGPVAGAAAVGPSQSLTTRSSLTRDILSGVGFSHALCRL